MEGWRETYSYKRDGEGQKYSTANTTLKHLKYVPYFCSTLYFTDYTKLYSRQYTNEINAHTELLLSLKIFYPMFYTAITLMIIITLK